jgi:hypothetical protein
MRGGAKSSPGSDNTLPNGFKAPPSFKDKQLWVPIGYELLGKQNGPPLRKWKFYAYIMCALFAMLAVAKQAGLYVIYIDSVGSHESLSKPKNKIHFLCCHVK